MMLFHEFVHEYNLRNKATSNFKIYEVMKKIGQESKVGTYSRDGNFSTNYGKVNLHRSRGTHWSVILKFLNKNHTAVHHQIKNF